MRAQEMGMSEACIPKMPRKKTGSIIGYKGHPLIAWQGRGKRTGALNKRC